MEFVVIDVETANQRPSSICQIGVACFRDGLLAEVWGVLVNPEDSFLPVNVHLHGIGPRDVSAAPTWPELQPKLRSLIEDRTIASHTYFDRTAVNGADMRYGLPSTPVAGWVDTCRIARQVWPHLASHKLTSLAQTFSLSYRAHDAIEDARCAGQVLLFAAHASTLNFAEILYPTQTRAALRRRRLFTKNDER